MTPLFAFLLGLTVGAAAVAVLWARSRPAVPASPVPLPNTEAAHAAVDAVPDADALKRDRERW